MIRSWHSSKRSRLWTGFAFAHHVSTPMPRTNPLMIRPPEIRSAIAICSATMIGLSWIGRMLPISAIFARFVWRARMAADIMIETSEHEGVL